MENIRNISTYGLFFGMIGTTLGGIIGSILNLNSNKLISSILEFAAGLMTAVVCFELIPESLEIIGISVCICGIFLGIILMALSDKTVDKFLNTSYQSNHLLKTGFVILIGLALHNFPEGLAIGAGFELSPSLRIYFSFSNSFT